MPVDMAMEEPRARIIGKEPNRDVITPLTSAGNVPANGINEVILCFSSWLYNIESMPVKMERMLRVAVNPRDQGKNKDEDTHIVYSDHVDLDAGVRRKVVNRSFGK